MELADCYSLVRTERLLKKAEIQASQDKSNELATNFHGLLT